MIGTVGLPLLNGATAFFTPAFLGGAGFRAGAALAGAVFTGAVFAADFFAGMVAVLAPM